MNRKLRVVLVDPNDQVIGTMEKMEAHRKGILHRAVSVFIFNKNFEWLLQRRAIDKYHSPGLWSNACCTHPHPGEAYPAAAKRRTKEELGIRPHLREVFRLIYEANLENGLIEHELDTIYIGFSDETANPNPEEVAEYKYISSEQLNKEITEHPDQFTPWFLKLHDRIETYISELKTHNQNVI